MARIDNAKTNLTDVTTVGTPMKDKDNKPEDRENYQIAYHRNHMARVTPLEDPAPLSLRQS